MRLSPRTKDALKLFHEGSLALAQVEANGIRVDVGYVKQAIIDTRETVRELDRQLRADKVFRVWKKRFGDSTNVYSDDQLRSVLYEELGYKPTEFTGKENRPSTNKKALVKYDLPFLRLRDRIKGLKKAVVTNLEAILRETDTSGFLHANFNLAGGGEDDATGGARSYRGSSSGPNFQNFPFRDEELAELVRRAFIPRKGFWGEEDDFKGIEVGISACYNHDPKLIEYVKGSASSVPEHKRKDMHRDLAMKLFFLEKDEVNKRTRHLGKNGFVFPEFYGSFYVDCARNIWEELERLKPGVEGSKETVLERLRKNGVKKMGRCDESKTPISGTFEHHVKSVEEWFWGKLLKVYAKWKRDYYDDYLRRCCFDLFTGFRVFGLYRRNQVVNYPVQGSAFHCLLWCLIELQKWLNKHKMKSMILGQIHDSMLKDTHRSELQDVIGKTMEIMSVDLPRKWDWIIVPLDVEIEVWEPGTSWFDKKPLAEMAL